jgi:hypothetical protein
MAQKILRNCLIILGSIIFFTLPRSVLACDVGGGEQCTPGFWKQNVSLQYWLAAGFSPNDQFQDVFGVPTMFGLTLMDVLNTGGGGVNALGRHAVAALLNASQPASTYAYSPAEITSSVGAALSQYQISLLSGAGVDLESSGIEDLKDVYEALNENQ